MAFTRALASFLLLPFRLLARVGRWLRKHRHYRRVAITGVKWIALDYDGSAQPGNYVFHDTASIEVDVSVSLPVCQDIFPLSLSLSLCLRKNGGGDQVAVQRVIASSEGWGGSTHISLGRETGIIDSPGIWAGTFVVDATGRELGHMLLEVLSEEALVRNLKVSDLHLVVSRGGESVQHREGQVILTDSEVVTAIGRIRPDAYDPSKYAGMKTIIELLAREGSVQIGAIPMPFAFKGKSACVVGARLPVTKGLLRTSGEWELTLGVQGYKLASILFRTVSAEEAASAVQLVGLDVYGIPVNSQAAPMSLGDRAYARNLRALAPTVRIKTPYPTPFLSFPLSFGVTLDGEPATLAKRQVTPIHKGSVHELGLLPLTELGPDAPPMGIELLVRMGAQQVRRLIVLSRELPECSDLQGRIRPEVLQEDGTDYEVEAAQILREAGA